MKYTEISKYTGSGNSIDVFLIFSSFPLLYQFLFTHPSLKGLMFYHSLFKSKCQRDEPTPTYIDRKSLLVLHPITKYTKVVTGYSFT